MAAHRSVGAAVMSLLHKATGLIGLIVCLSGCAVNRVEKVQAEFDAWSLYKVPVVYGIGVTKDSPDFEAIQAVDISFGEFDPVKGQGTASCFGSADEITISMGPKELADPERQVRYRVLMVPPGYYASFERSSSLIKIESGKTYYLGEYHITRGKEPHITYDDQRAAEALSQFNISAGKLERISRTAIAQGPGHILCMP